MAVLFDLGYLIARGIGSLSEGLGRIFTSIVTGFGKDLIGIGTDFIGDAATELEQDDTTLKADAERITEKTMDPITHGWDHSLEQVLKKHSPMTPEEAKVEVEDLYLTGFHDLQNSTISALVVEMASLGQIEGVLHLMEKMSRTRGLPQFLERKAQIDNETQFLERYEQYMNSRNQQKIPGASDLVRFALREVWDPRRRPELLQETPGNEYYRNMIFQGFGDDFSNDYWAAHWVLPSVGQLNEMLHRGVIDGATWDRFVKYNDFDPSVRPWLRAISYNPYTRVDARRMWDMSVLNDDELTRAYLDMGYDQVRADNMTLWTKIYVSFPDLVARFKNGWITQDEVLTELERLGMDPSRAQVLFETKFKAVEEERTVKERDLTKAEIVKGVKNQVITWTDGVELLMDMGYSESEADYILIINVEAATGSPHIWSEFQDIVNKRRKAMGQPVKKIPGSIKKLETQIKQYEEIRAQATKDGETPEFFTELDKTLNPLKRQHRHQVQDYQKKKAK